MTHSHSREAIRGFLYFGAVWLGVGLVGGTILTFFGVFGLALAFIALVLLFAIADSVSHSAPSGDDDPLG